MNKSRVIIESFLIEIKQQASKQAIEFQDFNLHQKYFH